MRVSLQAPSLRWITRALPTAKATFYYTDTEAGTPPDPTVTVTEGANYFTNIGDAAQSASQQVQVNAGTATQTIAVLLGQTYTPGKTALNEAVTGTPNAQTAGNAFNVTVRAVDAILQHRHGQHHDD